MIDETDGQEEPPFPFSTETGTGSDGGTEQQLLFPQLHPQFPELHPQELPQPQSAAGVTDAAGTCEAARSASVMSAVFAADSHGHGSEIHVQPAALSSGTEMQA